MVKAEPRLMNERSPFFTVVIPVIRTRYLEQAIQSVLSQTFGHFELIIIDDASPDPVESTVRRFTDRRIRFQKNVENRGSTSPAIVWNQGLAMARGRLTMILGDDDFYAEGVLESIYQLAMSHPDAAVFRVRMAIVNSGGETQMVSPRLAEYEPWWDVLYARARYGRIQSICEHAFSTENLRSEGHFWELPKAWGSDDAAVLSLAVKGGCYSSNDAMAYWRNDGNNLSSQQLPDYLPAIRKLLDWQREIVRTNETPDYLPKQAILTAIDERERLASNIYGRRSKFRAYAKWLFDSVFP